MRKQLVMIQLSRAIVPLFVLSFHTSLISREYFNYNFLKFSEVPTSGGVYYFFVLTGFMIYYIHKKDFGNKGKVKQFLLNRIIRIYPLYWIITLTILPAYFLFPSFGNGYETELHEIIKSLLLLPGENTPILIVAWSLVLTMLFYLVFCILIMFSKKVGLAITVIWAIMIILTNIFGYVPNESILLNYLLKDYNILFIIGMFCAEFIMRFRFSLKQAVVLSIIGFLGFPFSWINFVVDLVNISFFLSVTISSALLIVGLASIDMNKEVNIPSFANFAGKASLSIYLIHYPCLSVLSKIFSAISLHKIIGGLGTSLTLAVISTIVGLLVYRFLEFPITNVLKKVINREREQPSLQPVSKI